MPARSYQRGMKAFIEGRLLSANPYDASVSSKTNSAWRDGWLDASHAWFRLHGREASSTAAIIGGSIEGEGSKSWRAK